jgi:hypothetical protein
VRADARSLDLASALVSVAEELFQRPVLPGRAKGTTYFDDASWHRDSEHELAGVAPGIDQRYRATYHRTVRTPVRRRHDPLLVTGADWRRAFLAAADLKGYATSSPDG